LNCQEHQTTLIIAQAEACYTGSQDSDLSAARSPAEARPCASPTEKRSGNLDVVRQHEGPLAKYSAFPVDATGWDDQTESGNACLYEMHQMSRSLYKPYRPDKLNATALAQSTLPEKLTKAIPHVRMMVIAIRHKDQARALESGKAALAEMNGTSASTVSGGRTEPATQTREVAVVVKVRRVPKQALASGGM
jgi:hypothetical protein